MYPLNKLHCPCNKCKGRTLCNVSNERKHFILNGREPSFRIWRCLGDRDSSYEEWEAEWKTPITKHNQEFGLHTNIRGMVQDPFQQVDQPNILEEKAMEVPEKAFMIFDGL